ncbi:hypothetical protein ATK74_1752 [Propionicimonas paludicola]|uniref:Uncharacterized protein n=1 Tax=Propionicimonas paludicola TaxID=185243 RepID=A0A2A9CUF4_9ACTN|nr:hypothetical protein ATK74_1752 [Propionicimonas paludicola]
MYVRVRDENGHEFDVPEGSRLITQDLVELVEGVEPCSLRRPPKFAATPSEAAEDKSAKPRHRPGAQPPESPAQPDKSESDPAPDNPEKESE